MMNMLEYQCGNQLREQPDGENLYRCKESQKRTRIGQSEPTLVAKTANTNYIVLMPPGDVLKEKIFEMGMDASELAHHCQLPVETIRGILDTSVEMTQMIAEKLEQITRIQADSWMRMEEDYRKRKKLTANTQEYSIDEELGVALKRS